MKLPDLMWQMSLMNVGCVAHSDASRLLSDFLHKVLFDSVLAYVFEHSNGGAGESISEMCLCHHYLIRPLSSGDSSGISVNHGLHVSKKRPMKTSFVENG